MSYVKTTWVTGDIVTAPKLNNLESGVEANDLNKLNKPSGNGTAGQLLISNGDGSTSWTDTDTTLEESGKAADAKATGDAIGEINEALETKAEIDGYYEEMTVGDAEQLVSTVYVEESTPYLYRTTGGSADVGNREYLDKLVGVSVPWNQLVNPTTTTERGITATVNSNGSVTLAGTPTLLNVILWNIAPWVAGHKYLLKEYSSASKWAIYYGNYFRTSTTKNGDWRIVQATGSEAASVGISFLSLTEPINDTVEYQLFDLTKMFGTTIADYVYSLETATAGSGVAWLKQYIDLDTYHAYSAPTLKHVEDLQSHDTVGFNQWDEEWELGSLNGGTGLPVASDLFIRSKNFDKCFPGMAYYLYCGFGTNKMNVFWYDANQDFISVTTIKNEVATSPSNAHYFKIRSEQSYGNIYRNDTCINLSWSGYRNGEYEPYEKHSYALDSSVVLRGYPMLVDGQLKFDGDEYLYDGTINRNWGIVDLGTLTWTYISGGFFTAYLTGYKDRANGNSTIVTKAACSKYVAASIKNVYDGVDKTVALGTTNNYAGRILIKDSAYTDAASFTTALSGVYLVYELATPTTETADPYTQVQICDDFGTEQFVTTSIIPVGIATRYPANLRDKLQHLPSLAETDGTYLIQQTNKEMSLIPFSGYVTEESLSETLEDYAVVDGYYEGMTVGNAEELVTGLTEEESVPFIFRTAGGSLEIGAREDLMVTGGSLAWNQMVDRLLARTSSGVTSTVNGDGSVTINGTTTANGSLQLSYTSFPVPINHVFYVCGYKRQSTDDYMGFGGFTIDRGAGGIWKNTTTYDALTLRVDFSSGTVYDNVRIYPQYFDLTQMFGTTIADYIYNLEQTTAGAGVAWFKKLFPKDYYPYQASDLVHVNASEFKTIGFNQFDKSTVTVGQKVSTNGQIVGDTRISVSDYIKCLPNTAYYFKDYANLSKYVSVAYYDANKNYITYGGSTGASSSDEQASGWRTTPQNCYYMRINVPNGFVDSACVSIHWDNTRDGEYEPYTEHSYPLDSSLVLRGLPKIDADGNLYYDGDTYEADGTVTRKYGTVTFDGSSDENWISYGDTSNAHRFYIAINDKVPAPANSVIDSSFIAYGYETVSKGQIGNVGTVGKVSASDRNSKSIIFAVSLDMSLADFKASLSSKPIYVTYALETPTTETATPYQTPQIVDNWGTEEFVVTAQNGVEVPVGHSTIYPISLRDKLEAAPDLPDDDGDFVLRMSSGGASYARLASEFPTVPTSTDGVFVLKATVTNGTATLTWEAQS